jgi:hypothetical protein
MPHERVRGLEITGRGCRRSETLESERDAIEALEKGFVVGHREEGPRFAGAGPLL